MCDAALCGRGRERCVLFAGAPSDTLCAATYARGRSRRTLCVGASGSDALLYILEVVEGVRYVPELFDAQLFSSKPCISSTTQTISYSLALPTHVACPPPQSTTSTTSNTYRACPPTLRAYRARPPPHLPNMPSTAEQSIHHLRHTPRLA